MGQIYRHVAPNGKSYVGMTSKTWQQRAGAHPAAAYAPKFRNAILKYGWDNFKHEVLETVEDNSKLLEREAYWIKYYNSAVEGYNSLSDGRDHNNNDYINEVTADIKNEIKNKYVNEGYSVREMIEHFNMNWNRIKGILESLDVTIRGSNYISPRQAERRESNKWVPQELICAEESCNNIFIQKKKNNIYCSKSCSGCPTLKQII